jgi:hypothetical protein
VRTRRKLEGRWAPSRVQSFHRDGVKLSDADAARLLVAVESIAIRDRLWLDMSRGNAASHVALWTDMTRRAPDEVRAAPASLLAFGSWLNGHGAMAWCALDQVPEGKPYALANLVAAAVQRGMHLDAGACIQGFLLVALAVIAGGSVLLGLPVGAVLDLTTPGIFFGVAIGRPGCFFTGCCAGRPTRHSWGLVSSDRRLTARRFPVQLYEATAGLVLGLVSLSLLSLSTPAVEGVVFIVSVAAYTLVRQFLFPLRTDPHTRAGRLLTITASSLVVAGGLAVL